MKRDFLVQQKTKEEEEKLDKQNLQGYQSIQEYQTKFDTDIVTRNSRWCEKKEAKLNQVKKHFEEIEQKENTYRPKIVNFIHTFYIKNKNIQNPDSKNNENSTMQLSSRFAQKGIENHLSRIERGKIDKENKLCNNNFCFT